jgi:WD40 repeat protein
VATGKQLARWPGYDQMPGTLVFSPTGKHIAAAGYGGSARVHDLEGKILASRVVVVPPGRTIAFRPDGKVLAVAVGKEVETWDWAADKVLRRWEVSAGPLPLSALAYSPDGKTLATAQHGAAIRLWDADTGTPKGGREGSGHDRGVSALYWHPGGEKLFSVGEDETVRTWDVAARKTIHVLDRLPKTVVAVAVSPDARLIASASENQNLGVWDAATGKRLWEVAKLPVGGEFHSRRQAAGRRRQRRAGAAVRRRVAQGGQQAGAAAVRRPPAGVLAGRALPGGHLAGRDVVDAVPLGPGRGRAAAPVLRRELPAARRAVQP